MENRLETRLERRHFTLELSPKSTTVSIKSVVRIIVAFDTPARQIGDQLCEKERGVRLARSDLASPNARSGLTITVNHHLSLPTFPHHAREADRPPPPGIRHAAPRNATELCSRLKPVLDATLPPSPAPLQKRFPPAADTGEPRIQTEQTHTP